MKLTLTRSILRSGMAVFFCALIVAQPALADDYTFYSLNDVLYYDKDASVCSGNASTPASSAATSAEEDARAKTILTYFTSKGLTLAQATGFAGNMHAESTIDPTSYQGGKADSNYTMVDGVGFGLVQWTHTGRQQPLADAAKKANLPVINMGVQLDYIWTELNTTYKSTLQALTADASISPVDATIIIHGKTALTQSDSRFANAPSLGYEASGDTVKMVLDNRASKAQYYYDLYKDTIKDGTGVQGAVSTTIGGTTEPCSSAAVASTDCNVTAPVYGAGGNSHQLTATELASVFGGPDPNAIKPNLVMVDFLGKQVQVNKLVAGCLQAVANEIKVKNVDYTIKAMGGYRFDSDNGSSNIGTKSYHTYGAAVDINPDTNGYYSSGTGPHDMPQAYIDAFNHHGWSWGGSWIRSKDYMHFEFNGIGPGSKP